VNPETGPFGAGMHDVARRLQSVRGNLIRLSTGNDTP
jgi:hypothetical protein